MQKKNVSTRILRTGGYTLIELLVSLSLFTIVALAMVTSLYTVNAAWKRVQAMKTVMDNLNFAVESISRNIRTANTIVCGGEANLGKPTDYCRFDSGAGSGDSVIAMNSTLGDSKAIEYSVNLSTKQIEKRVKEGTSLGQSGIWLNKVAVTTPEIAIDRLRFYVQGSLATDGEQPSVIISIQGKATAVGQTIPFSIQTYVSQRNIE